jgi:hypothetical protein
MVKVSDVSKRVFLAVLVASLLVILYVNHSDSFENKPSAEAPNLLKNTAVNGMRGMITGYLLGDFESGLITGMAAAVVTPVVEFIAKKI